MASPSTVRSSVATISHASAHLSAPTISALAAPQISSTPMRSSNSGLVTTKHTHMTVDGVVRDELAHALYRDCSLEDILKSIFGLTDAQLRGLQESARDLAQKFLADEKLKQLEEKYLTQALEPDAYVPFCDLVDGIIERLDVEGDNRFLAIGQDNITLAHGMGDRKPDVTLAAKAVYDAFLKKQATFPSGNVAPPHPSLKHNSTPSDEVGLILEAVHALAFIECKWEKGKNHRRGRKSGTVSKHTPLPTATTPSSPNSSRPSPSSLSDRSKLQPTATKRARSQPADAPLPRKRKKLPDGSAITPALPITPTSLSGGATNDDLSVADDDVFGAVVKVCFPPKTRKSEVEFITLLRQHDDIMDMVPQVFAHSTIEMPDFLELVRRSKSKPKVEPDVREMRVFVMKRYHTLSEVTSADDLLSIIKDIGRCHTHSFNKAHFLHQDITFNNIGWYRDEEKRARGVLLDWDLAAEVNEAGEPMGATARHRTGTPAYMSVRLLQSHDSNHEPIDDKESLFWVLVSAMTRKHFHGSDFFKEFRRGGQDMWAQIARQKKAFLEDLMQSEGSQWPQHVHENFRVLLPTINRWAIDLEQLSLLSRMARLPDDPFWSVVGVPEKLSQAKSMLNGLEALFGISDHITHHLFSITMLFNTYTTVALIAITTVGSAMSLGNPSLDGLEGRSFDEEEHRIERRIKREKPCNPKYQNCGDKVGHVKRPKDWVIECSLDDEDYELEKPCNPKY
ncbi:hypothetical protein DACRYDRAFT_16607 [Dacryopinax primogenitus]|uniref:Protein kinase domain-containing protein n=1 Tax=Dacryopinax primogenitus (strain DJM 731) TaxID=1858805 RepID=M5FW79_DACPD|nr:uncharacterized protein DACRYDRAFT_16607 [Dacryopinax primogenitus]EJU00624.1 hypothetical protein DACRYDRAFT_16607 [Dacryopinax primogenitus]